MTLCAAAPACRPLMIPTGRPMTPLPTSTSTPPNRPSGMPPPMFSTGTRADGEGPAAELWLMKGPDKDRPELVGMIDGTRVYGRVIDEILDDGHVRRLSFENVANWDGDHRERIEAFKGRMLLNPRGEPILQIQRAGAPHFQDASGAEWAVYLNAASNASDPLLQSLGLSLELRDQLASRPTAKRAMRP